MKTDDLMRPEQIIGALLFSGAFQFMLCMLIAESNYPGYNIFNDFISELGVGATSNIFNISVSLLGLSMIFSGYFLSRIRSPVFAFLVMLAGMGAFGVGLFPMDRPGTYHVLFSFMAFLFGGLAAAASYKKEQAAISVLSVILGIVSLAALALFASGNMLFLGMGFMERMVAWPILAWASVFGFGTMGCCRNRI